MVECSRRRVSWSHLDARIKRARDRFSDRRAKAPSGAHEDWIRACVFNPSGTHLLSAGRDMTVKLTEVETERFIDNVTSITPGALRGGINSLAMHPVKDEVLVGGSDGAPKIYRISARPSELSGTTRT